MWDGCRWTNTTTMRYPACGVQTEHLRGRDLTSCDPPTLFRHEGGHIGHAQFGERREGRQAAARGPHRTSQVRSSSLSEGSRWTTVQRLVSSVDIRPLDRSIRDSRLALPSPDVLLRLTTRAGRRSLVHHMATSRTSVRLTLVLQADAGMQRPPVNAGGAVGAGRGGLVRTTR